MVNALFAVFRGKKRRKILLLHPQKMMDEARSRFSCALHIWAGEPGLKKERSLISDAPNYPQLPRSLARGNDDAVKWFRNRAFASEKERAFIATFLYRRRERKKGRKTLRNDREWSRKRMQKKYVGGKDVVEEREKNTEICAFLETFSVTKFWTIKLGFNRPPFGTDYERQKMQFTATHYYYGRGEGIFY